MKRHTVEVSVPGTSANLGPGFDCIGVALALRNRVTFTPRIEGFAIHVEGEGAATIPQDEQNLVVLAARRLFALAAERCRLGQKEAEHLSRLPFKIQQKNQVPVMSGLGSSATAVVSGMLAANSYLDEPFGLSELTVMCCQLEGHPDNVTPALMGGVRLALEATPPINRSVATPMDRVAVVTPAFHFPTAEARAALPKQVAFQDALFNISRMGLLVRAFQDGDYELLRRCMQDRLHQPYRLSRIPGAEMAVEAGTELGAGVALSGAGPSLIAFAESRLEEIAGVMREAFSDAGLESRVWILDIDQRGSDVQLSPA